MAEMWISMGPQHPMTHGLWTLKIKVDGETVIDTEPDLGYIHRGVEKICESRDFTQITTYCDRLCYASANTWSHAYIYAAEDLLDVEVPERAEYIRLVAVEIQRIASHLMWLGQLHRQKRSCSGLSAEVCILHMIAFGVSHRLALITKLLRC